MKKRTVMNALLGISLLLSSSTISAQAIGGGLQIEFNTSWGDPTPDTPGYPKSPVRPPQVSLEDNVLTFETFHPDYTLTLFDEDGEVVYQTAVLAGTDTVVLPSILSGSYVLTLDFGGSYYFWSEIEL